MTRYVESGRADDILTATGVGIVRDMYKNELDRGYEAGLVEDDDYMRLLGELAEMEDPEDVYDFDAMLDDLDYDAVIADLDAETGTDDPTRGGPDRDYDVGSFGPHRTGGPDDTDTPDDTDDPTDDPDDTDDTDDPTDTPDDDTDDDTLDYEIDVVTGDLSPKSPWQEVRQNGLVDGLRNTYMQNEVPYAITLSGEDADELYEKLEDDDSDFELSIKGGRGSPSAEDDDIYFDALGNLLGGVGSSDAQYEEVLDDFDMTEFGDTYVLHGFDSLQLAEGEDYTYWAELDVGDDTEYQSDAVTPDPEGRSFEEDWDDMNEAWDDAMYFDTDDQRSFLGELTNAFREDFNMLKDVGRAFGREVTNARR